MGLQSIGSDKARSSDGNGPSPEAIEGQLLAHRQVLALVIAELRKKDGAADLMAALDSLCVMQDHQEDPGATVDGAVAIQGALAEEVGLIVRASAASAA